MQHRERNVLHNLISVDFGRIGSAQKILNLNPLIKPFECPLFPNFIIVKSDTYFSIRLVSSDISFRALVATTTQCNSFLNNIIIIIIIILY